MNKHRLIRFMALLSACVVLPGITLAQAPARGSMAELEVK